MKLDPNKILDRANELYARAKTAHIPSEDLSYWAPEMFPKIASDQVKSILTALVEAINQQSNDNGN